MFLRSNISSADLAASCSNQEFMSLALRKDLCRKLSLSCFFLRRRLLNLPSGGRLLFTILKFARFTTPDCLSSTIALLVAFVVTDPLDFLLSRLTPSCTRIMSTDVLLKHQWFQIKLNFMWSQETWPHDIIEHKVVKKSVGKTFIKFLLSHLNSFLISVPRLCETMLTFTPNFRASCLKRQELNKYNDLQIIWYMYLLICMIWQGKILSI